MFKQIYAPSIEVLAKKPFRLWGISLLGGFLTFLAGVLFGIIPGVNLAISILLSTALQLVYLKGLHGEQVFAVDLFACCKDWKTVKRVLAGVGWSALWVFLWCLIPIVGIIFGIIKSYSYCLVPYILANEPDVAPTEAIKVSQARTKGYKGEMFGADILPFLAEAAVFVVLSLLGRIPYIGVLFTIINVIVLIAFIIFVPLFLGLVHASYYEKLTNTETPVQE